MCHLEPADMINWTEQNVSYTIDHFTTQAYCNTNKPSKFQPNKLEHTEA